MTDRPSRATPGGRAYLELRRLARERNRPTDELLQLYALEGFLARLSASPHARRFVLKGGVLLAAFDARRPTKDIDLAGIGLANDEESVKDAIRSVLAIELDDGLHFELTRTAAEAIREADEYSGIRVTVPCSLASARLGLQIDINVGDPISPPPAAVSIPRILGGEPLIVTGYPLAMVFAEKIVTALQRGAANTRWRDFADIVLLSRQHPIAGPDLAQALHTVASYRSVPLSPLGSALEGFAETAQNGWSSWRRRHRMEDRIPAPFADLLATAIAFADPALTGSVANATWNPDSLAWA